MTYPTNMSITNYGRPPMKQEDHPDHNMPASEYNGDAPKDQSRYGDDVGGDYGQNQAQFWARRKEK